MEKMTKILICDENEDFRRITGEYLKNAGIGITEEAADGEEALAKIGKFSPDIVIIDLWMPRLDTVSIIKSCRRIDRMSGNIPSFIVTTQLNNPTMLAEADRCEGPWKVLGDVCVGDTTESTFHSQISCIFKHQKKDLYIAVGDRWLVDLDLKYLPMIREGHRELQSGKPCPDPKYTWAQIRGLSKRNTSIATYVWLPVRFDENGRPYISWEDEWKLEDFG